ncbi:MAG: hypothetical protein CMQ34_10045 [Gammaproteobacteria bacterium]|nr:hypothetical protein [Gammaproteobacteria bacterium]
MPKAILALRSYPLAILMALVLFVCSLLIATSSIGGGGDDQGSGMGGTGRTGGFNGDSGLGGTGGPSPFLGSTDGPDTTGTRHDGIDTGSNTPDSLIEPFLQQLDTETARIPDEMRPLIELQRNTPQSPEFRDNAPALDILDDERQDMPPHARRLLDMAEADNATLVAPTLEIQVQIPENTGTDDIERFRMEVAEPEASALPDLDAAPDAELDVPLILEQLPTDGIAGNDAAPGLADDNLADENPLDSNRPLIPERIQRPELPPFQRMRPAVDRASIAPPRPRPMPI